MTEKCETCAKFKQTYQDYGDCYRRDLAVPIYADACCPDWTERKPPKDWADEAIRRIENERPCPDLHARYRAILHELAPKPLVVDYDLASRIAWAVAHRPSMIGMEEAILKVLREATQPSAP